jgi:hypothetical protein
MNLGFRRVVFARAPCAMIACVSLMALHAVAGAETATEKKRAQFAVVHRIAVVPPFYGTGRLGKAEVSASDAAAAKPNPKLAEYIDRLRKLQERTRTLLPERLAARTPFQMVPMEETEAALKALELTPEKLYQNDSRMKGTKFAAPDPAQARKLAAQLHVDAVVFDTLDEPRRSPERLFFDPLGGFGVSEEHVSAKVGFWVLLADGTEAFQRVSDVVHPVTRIGNRAFLFADWQEASDLAIENFLDELTRYTPEKTGEGKHPGGQ